MKCKIGILPIANKGKSPDDMRTFMKKAEKEYTLSEFDILQPEDVLSDEVEILAQVKIYEHQEVDVVLVVTGSWLYSSLVIATVNDLSIPFILYGISDRIANGSLGISVQIKYVLEEMGKNFLYITGKIDDEENQRKIQSYAQAAAVKKAMRNKKIATIGGKCMMMYQTQVNEFDYKRVYGFDFPQYDTVQIFKEMEKIDESEARKVADKYVAKCKKINWELETGEIIEKDTILMQAKMYLAFKRMKDLFDIEVFANKCMPEMMNEVYGCSYGGCLATSMLNDDGIMTACEADLPAGISMYILHKFTGSATFFADIGKVDKSENTITMFNCGSAPFSYAGKEGVTLWPIPAFMANDSVPYEYYATKVKGACIHLNIDSGQTITMLRVGGNGDTMRMHVCKATTVVRETTPDDVESIRWPGLGMKTKNDISNFLDHATGHHYAICLGDITQKLKYLADILGVKYVFDE